MSRGPAGRPQHLGQLEGSWTRPHLCPRSHLENEVVNVHLLLLFQNVDDQTVNVVPLPFQCAGSVFIHIQVHLSGQQLDGCGDAVHATGRHLLVDPQDT